MYGKDNARTPSKSPSKTNKKPVVPKAAGIKSKPIEKKKPAAVKRSVPAAAATVYVKFNFKPPKRKRTESELSVDLEDLESISVAAFSPAKLARSAATSSSDGVPSSLKSQKSPAAAVSAASKIVTPSKAKAHSSKSPVTNSAKKKSPKSAPKPQNPNKAVESAASKAAQADKKALKSQAISTPAKAANKASKSKASKIKPSKAKASPASKTNRPKATDRKFAQKKPAKA